MLSVEDTGDGLDADELERVFERFYRAPGAAAHGGRMWVESDRRGQGSRFSMRLPAA